ncbi:hypothetical protein RCL1_001957 [Eukaryota sp. TZLM3-RCL]
MAVVGELLKSIAEDNVSQMAHIIRLFRNPNRSLDEKGHTALHLTICEGSTESVAVAIDCGCSISHPNKDGWLPIHLACTRSLEIVQLLLALGVSLDSTTSNGFTCLHIAVTYNKFEIVEFLLTSSSLNINTSSHNLTTPLHCALVPYADVKDNLSMVSLLVESGASLSSLDAEGASILHYLIKNFQDCEDAVELMSYLVTQGADIYWKLKVECPLYQAISLEKLNFISTLISLGALNDDVAPAHYALSHSKWRSLCVVLSCLEVLDGYEWMKISLGNVINSEDMDIAVKNGLDLIKSQSIFHKMIDENVDDDVMDDVIAHLNVIADVLFDHSDLLYKTTALYYAVMKNHHHMIDLLLSFDCNPLREIVVIDCHHNSSFSTPLLASVVYFPVFENFSRLFAQSLSFLSMDELGSLLIEATKVFGSNPTDCYLIIKELLDYGASASYFDSKSQSCPMINLVKSKFSSEISDFECSSSMSATFKSTVLLLQSAGAPIQSNLIESCPFIAAIQADNYLAIDTLISLGANPGVFLPIPSIQSKLVVDIEFPVICLVKSLGALKILIKNLSLVGVCAKSPSLSHDDVMTFLWNNNLLWTVSPFYTVVLSPFWYKIADDEISESLKILQSNHVIMSRDIESILPPLSLSISRGLLFSSLTLLDFSSNPNALTSSHKLKNLAHIRSIMSSTSEPIYFSRDYQLSPLDVFVFCHAVNLFTNYSEVEVKSFFSRFISHEKTTPYIVEKALSLAVYHESIIFDWLISSPYCISKSREWLILPSLSSSPCSPHVVAIFINSPSLLSSLLSCTPSSSIDLDLSEIAVKLKNHEVLAVLYEHDIPLSEDSFFTAFDHNDVETASLVVELMRRQVESGVIKSDDDDSIIQKLQLALDAMVQLSISPQKSRKREKGGRNTPVKQVRPGSGGKMSPQCSFSPKPSNLSPRNCSSKTPLSLRLVPF